jgi:GTA TIM-barrel-like domain/Putative phage tail protein
MASLVLGIAGEAVGPSLFGAGFSLFGATVTGAQIGGAIGAFAGSLIDAALAPGRHVTGPRLSDVNIQSSTEGAAIPRVYGRVRVAGQLIWATQYDQTTSTTSTGGKGFAAPSTSETTYNYSISFAVGLCEGPVAMIGRVWADGTLIDLSQFTTRFYPGDETQAQDPLIQEIEGEGNTPAWRGLCVMVFEDVPLAQFGNRIPQLQFEVIRPISDSDPSALENVLCGVALIPGAGEFVYASDVVTADDGNGTTEPQNAHNASGVADITASLDALQGLAPNLKAASLVVGWFGSDLRCDQTQIQPGVETAQKNTYPDTWSVNGVARGAAHLVSQVNGLPAYGGTPSDKSVVDAIANLKARGLRVLFYPFLFMDVASGNALSDPYTGAAPQPAYPWRGRITCDPARGVSGSPDKTSAAAAQIDAFFGAAGVSDYAVSGTSVSWTGGTDWGYRRMVLHYAHLCAAAGGVDGFVIGSELRGLTQVRSDATTYPAVAALKTLAADVRTILGTAAKIGYAADWSEYNNHQTGDAPGAVLFNLDPLWSDSNIDFIGIDNYMPLADWRDGTAHRDYNPAGPTSIYDPTYLSGNIKGGEDYDWFYASSADRDSQTRTAIADGAGKPWVWRAKDIWNWWANNHYDRPSGTEDASATAWVPQSKPVWFTELGCPAVDKGANEPNVFVDPKSSESALPYYSDGERDDLVQRRFLEAHLNYWTNAANNPASTVYSGAMVDVANIYAWCWDARPFPFFPAYANVWGDAADYTLGHWLNGRLGEILLPDLATKICADADFSAIDVSGLDGLVTGYAVTDTMSPRDALSPVSVAFQFDAVESEGIVKFVARGRPTATALDEGDLVLADSGQPDFGFTLVRAEETDMPLCSRVGYIDVDADYRQAVAEARRLIGTADRTADSQLPIVMDQATAIGIGERLLMDAWTMRESAQFSLAPSQLALDPTDEVELAAGGRTYRLRLTAIDDTASRAVQAVATDPSIYEAIVGPSRAPSVAQQVVQTGRALVVFADLPLLTADQTPWEPFAAAFADPWPGSVLVLKSASDSNYTLDATLAAPACVGQTTADFYSGPAWRWDEVNSLCVQLTGGTLASLDDLSVLGGANALAVQNAGGEWEVLQFATAALTAPNRYTLSKLLRGQAGTENEMGSPVAAGARVVVLNTAMQQLSLPQDQYALAFNYLWGPQGKPISDPSYQGASLQFEGVGLRPFAPCQLKAVYDAGGSDLVLSWIRRDRSPGADSWEAAEIPMSESSESYDVEILDASGNVVRTFASLPSPDATYTAAEIASDFASGLPSPFRFTAYQLSSVFGRGPGKTGQFFFA